MKSIYEETAENFAKKWGVELRILRSERKRNELWNDDEDRYCFRCRIKRGEKSYCFDFWQSIAEGSNEPTMYDILACFVKSEVGSFEDFCAEYGYEFKYAEDYSRVRKIWRACKREWENVWNLFGDDEECWNELCEIN